MTINTHARIVCSKNTRERLRRCKRGGETFDELLVRMLEQYEPPQVGEIDTSGPGAADE